MPFQLADIERPLVAVSALAKAGNAVELNHDGGKITHALNGGAEHTFFACGFRLMLLLFTGRGPGE